MKKINCFVFAIALILSGFAIAPLSFASTTVDAAGTNVEAPKGYTVNVYKIQGNITAKTTGYYDSDDNTISVHGQTLRVYDNPNYGKGGKTGSYRYMAGSNYFFNL